MAELNLDVSRIGLGCVTFGREIDEAASVQIMDFAATQGINLFDTAASYGSGASELIVGRWLRASGNRDKVFLQSKVKPPFTREHLHRSLLDTLDRLQIEQLDSYLLHEYDPLSPLEQTMEGLTELMQSGRVRAIGCSNFTLGQLRAANALCKQGYIPLTLIEPVYNLLARDIEHGQLQYCKENAIGVITYSPLAAGFLTGKYASASGPIPAGSRFDTVPAHRDLYFSPENFETVKKLAQLAAECGMPVYRLAMGWALRQTDVMSTLIGATSISHVSLAIEALQSPLDSKTLEAIDRFIQCREQSFDARKSSGRQK